MIKKINYEETYAIRQIVMWPNKHLEYIMLDDDPKGEHYGLFVDSKLISVISVFITENSAQFRKFATLSQYQGKGYGTLLLSYVLKQLEKMGIKRVWCNARLDKADYYGKFEFVKTDIFFEKGAKKYVIMEKTNHV
ncbi:MULTISPECIES: GNAT family N-acetyltransferase [unclassified Fusibacter]|uniref:GNAT family N-acetyltransferase n=1 Tax=unclassified Fusibacter TaxID=2624464 RepID=UPI0010120AAC|nr:MULTISPECIES: GNAT family N-acetyltransferase [unclassified Fusibacter]MCK8058344.1 GNAT family N-acetyltransferase [Fusibacter sp. A2]NPE20927.1 GNAT family N-acetyltransferase [Fusibacter sp. A1]RXV63130.1 GNAT family N-acetyltransferase [Fusibacter sp. A1]